MGSSVSLNQHGCASFPMCECADKEENVQMYDGNPLYHSFPTSKFGQLEEEVTDKQVSWALEMDTKPEPARRNSKSRLTRNTSRMSKMSGISCSTIGSTGTAHPGAKSARMTFDIRTNEYAYDEDQIMRLLDVQPDGTVVVNGLMPPLAVTSDGHTGILSGDVILEVAGSHDRGEDCLRDLTAALAVGGVVTLVVATRPEYFDIELWCEAEYWHKLGCIVTIEKEHVDRIKVQSVQDVGLLPAWNKVSPAMQVLPGDWIVSVNGEEKTAQEMAKDIHNTCEGDCLELGIQSRPRIIPGGMNAMGASNTKRNNRRQPEVERAGPSQWELLKSNFAMS